MDSSQNSLGARLLSKMASGDGVAERQLFELVYSELHDQAQKLMRRQPAGHTLQPTALVHEAWMKLVPGAPGHVSSQGHFLKLATRAMRSILVDHARGRVAAKRGGAAERLSLELHEPGSADEGADLLDLDEALKELARVDRSLAQVAELRLFGGLDHSEIASALGVSTRTAERGWKLSREWLQTRLRSNLG